MVAKHNAKKRSKAKRKNDHTRRLNFVTEAGPGCHLAVKNESSSCWVLSWEAIDPSEYGDAVPDIGIDPEERTISLCNVEDAVKIAYISILDVPLRGKHSQTLRQGMTRIDDKEIPCTTLIVQCPALTFCHLCHFSGDPQSLRLESDVQVWNEHPDTADTYNRILGFPIVGVSNLLCTQGEGGRLTHFFRGNYHAVDFRCPIGTPLVAVGDGMVIQVMDSNDSVSGIGVANLYRWNSILLQLDQSDLVPLPEDCDSDERHAIRSSPELYVEYVHIRASSVQVGDKIRKGQVIGTSGSAGFSPEPHLHFAAYRSRADDAPTCRVYFAGSDGVVIPTAGQCYTLAGES